MNRTTILMETSYLIAQPKPSMRQRITDFAGLWQTAHSGQNEQLEHVREEILYELDGSAGCMSLVSERVRRARDITDLWFLRCSLASALTVDRGADEASLSMFKITALFNGLLPTGLRERRSALNH